MSSWSSSSSLLTCWSPSPCTCLSHARTTTGPPPRPAAIGGRHTYPPPQREGTTGRFPRSSPFGRPVRRPVLPRQHRHAYAAVLHRGLPTGIERPASESPSPGDGVRCVPAHICQVRAGGTVTGFQTLVPRVRLPISLAEPGPSDSAGLPGFVRAALTRRLSPRRGCPQLPHAAATTQGTGSCTPSRTGNASWRTSILFHLLVPGG